MIDWTVGGLLFAAFYDADIGFMLVQTSVQSVPSYRNQRNSMPWAMMTHNSAHIVPFSEPHWIYLGSMALTTVILSPPHRIHMS